ncbi:ubiquinone biosynthesis protein COQ9, mitochondrial-like isoform X2 [Symsagittifera roscoffensis]|uniref:ubiquinone biosynthesis protein COQ9, mitochondrial-like isoform X2 n=1 Tax=Symsagittifera roscoffensis TaxID=84072 RepID=UPI00307C6CC9
MMTITGIPKQKKAQLLPGVKKRTIVDSKLKETQNTLLHESLKFVPEHGWSSKSIAEAAKSLELSPSIMNSFSKSEDAALVAFFLSLKMVDLENFLIALRSQHLEEHGRVKINLFVFEACKEMMSYVLPYLKHWSSALSILAEPSNAIDTLKHHSEMVDLIWHYAGDTSLDYNWYSKRILLSGVINSTQLHLLQDNSENFEDTWIFLESRLKDVASIGMGINNFRKSLSKLAAIGEVASETGRNLAGVPNTNR